MQGTSFRLNVNTETIDICNKLYKYADWLESIHQKASSDPWAYQNDGCMITDKDNEEDFLEVPGFGRGSVNSTNVPLVVTTRNILAQQIEMMRSVAMRLTNSFSSQLGHKELVASAVALCDAIEKEMKEEL